MSRGRSTAVAGIALVLLLLAGCHGDPNVRKQKYLESGNRYSERGKYKEAAMEYRKALAGDANFSEAHHQLARACLHLGQFSDAAAELSRTVELQPNNDKTRIELGNLLLAGGKTADAAAQANAILAINPASADAHALLSAVAAHGTQTEQAIAEMRRAVELDPQRAAFHEALARLSMSLPGQAALVETELNRAIALDPQSARARLLLAQFYLHAGRAADAEQMSWNAITADPRSLAARRCLAQVLLREGKQAYAEEVLRQASRDLEDDPQGVRVLADYYSASGQFDRAGAEFASLCADHPADLSLRKAYARTLLAAGDYRGAQPVIAELIKKDSDDPGVHGMQGILLLHDGAVGDARNILQDTVLHVPRDSFFQYWLGLAALAQGDQSLAEKSLRQAAALNPAALNVQQQLAQLACRREDMKLLSEVADQTIAAAPQVPDGYLWRARVEMSRNEPARAEADLKAAIAAAPQNAPAYLQFGKLRFAQRRFKEGVELLEQALQHDPDSVQAMRMLISYDLYRNRPAIARTRLAAQLLKRPGNSGYFVLLAQLEQLDKQPEAALAAAEHAICLNSGDAEAVVLYTRLQVQRGQTGHAVAAWQQWLNQHPRDAGALAILGALAEAQGDGLRAEAYYREALRIEPQQPVAANNLAYRMLENGEDVDAALAYAQTARQAMQNSAHIADTLAWAWYHKGAYEFARNLLEDAVKEEPNDVAIQYHLGMVYGKLNEKHNAVTHLRRAVSLAPESPPGKGAKAALNGIIAWQPARDGGPVHRAPHRHAGLSRLRNTSTPGAQ